MNIIILGLLAYISLTVADPEPAVFESYKTTDDTALLSDRDRHNIGHNFGITGIGNSLGTRFGNGLGLGGINGGIPGISGGFVGINGGIPGITGGFGGINGGIPGISGGFGGINGGFGGINEGFGGINGGFGGINGGFGGINRVFGNRFGSGLGVGFGSGLLPGYGQSSGFGFNRGFPFSPRLGINSVTNQFTPAGYDFYDPYGLYNERRQGNIIPFNQNRNFGFNTNNIGHGLVYPGVNNIGLGSYPGNNILTTDIYNRRLNTGFDPIQSNIGNPLQYRHLRNTKITPHQGRFKKGTDGGKIIINGNSKVNTDLQVNPKNHVVKGHFARHEFGIGSDFNQDRYNDVKISRIVKRFQETSPEVTRKEDNN